MTRSTTVADAQPVAVNRVNPWMASLYGGLITAVIAIAFHFLLPMNIPVLYALALLLLGVGPVLGYQLAAGKLGSDWGAIVGGILGSIIPILGQLLLWPLLVWLFNRRFSLGRLYLGSLIGIVLAFVVFFAIGFLMGQDPYAWTGLAWTLAASAWGGSAAAGMTGSEDDLR
jgi:hypothetical protein